MRKLFFLIVAACLLVTDAIAQKKDTIAYGLNLDEVQIVARRIRHANEANAGAKVTHLEPELLQINKTRSFSELLTENSATYITSLGTGAISTASFRGGSAAQTRVNWNGIKVYRIDAMDAANEMNNAKAFNMIVLGGLLQLRPIVTLENVIKGLKKTLPERHHHLIPMNEEAIKKGMELIHEV